MKYGTAEEKQRFTKSAWTNLLGGIGIAMAFFVSLPFLLGTIGGELVWLVLLAVVIAELALWVFGCSRYALSKGYDPKFGFVGIFGIFGLLFLGLKQDLWAEELDAQPVMPPNSDLSNYPR